MKRRVMVTEIMASVIVIGVILVLAVRRNSGVSAKAANDELTRSTEELRRELERSGDEIVARIAEHVNRLELLVGQAEERSKRLREDEKRLLDLQQELAQQLTEGHILQQRMKSQIASLGNLDNVGNSAAAQPLPETSPPRDFSSILAQSIEREEAPEEVVAAEDEDNFESPAAPNPPPKIPTSMGERSITINDLADTGAGKARTLLQQGLSVEDVSKETGMGRGAVELLQQMILRQKK